MKRAWKEFLNEPDIEAPTSSAESSRRTFLQLMGYSAAATLLASCRPPEQKIVPYLDRPVELTPGRAAWYATTCHGCRAACGALAKVRDGRPIKLEGNPEHALSRGGLCALAHGLVFELYDSRRLPGPRIDGRPADWEEVDAAVRMELDSLRSRGGKVRLLTGSRVGPTCRRVIEGLLEGFEGGRHVVYESSSMSAIPAAHSQSHQLAAFPRYRLDRTSLLVSFSADLLGTWLSPVEFTRGYAEARRPDRDSGAGLRHVQLESILSLSGCSADLRIPLSPGDELKALVYVAVRILEETGWMERPATGAFPLLPPEREASLASLTDQLLAARGRSLVISGRNDVAAQYLVNLVNAALGNYGRSLELSAGRPRQAENDAAMESLLEEMERGEVSALLIRGVNPIYDYRQSDRFRKALEKVPLSVSFSSVPDETAEQVRFQCPEPHFLERWGDDEPSPGVYCLTQPTIAPLYRTRPFEESLLNWQGDDRSQHDLLRSVWLTEFFPRQARFGNFDVFWDHSLHDGVFEPGGTPVREIEVDPSRLEESIARLREATTAADRGLVLQLYEKVGVRDGTQGGNPWLRELPDPVTKITWRNYLCIAPGLARTRDWQEGDVVRVTDERYQVDVPVHIQPGQPEEVVALALGFGSRLTPGGSKEQGVNAYPFVRFEGGTFRYWCSGITLQETGQHIRFAKTQTHESAEGRELVLTTTPGEPAVTASSEHSTEAQPTKLWDEHEYTRHKWGMVIDLNACTGCSACIASCQAENNIPVVGEDEVRRRREMHWLRIDRYIEGPDENPTIDFQPMLCQHCDNASCESVCPVLATVHSSDGLNMQVYNRCVGTRYCANNCAFKVRRFNWFEYSHGDETARLALNPDVTVRSRGVMEKCTFCVQRIQDVKIRARNEGRPIADGEVQPACRQSCPADAIIFGDQLDPDSQAARLSHDRRNYRLLEHLNLGPAVSYLAKVRNPGQKD